MDSFHLQTSAFRQAKRPRGKTASPKSATVQRTSPGGKIVDAQMTGEADTIKAVEVARPTGRKRRVAPSSDGVADVAWVEDTEAVEIELKVSGGVVVIEVRSSQNEDWEPVADSVVKRGLEALLRRESRLERAASRYGIAVEALLGSLERSVVDVSDESGGLPVAERSALTEAGISLQGSPQDPSGAGEVVKGMARFEHFRASALTVPETAALLKRTPGRVRQMLTAGQLVSVGAGESGHLLPSWQFAGADTVPQLSAVLEAVGEVHPLTLAEFMTRPDVDLEVDGTPVSPVQWLVSGGDVEPVVGLLAGLGVYA